MVLGLALCTTVAFAQTGKFRTDEFATKGEAVAKVFDTPQVDYKASIFTKAVGDTIYTFDFASTNFATDVVAYGENGYITDANNHVYMYNEEQDAWGDSTLTPHAQTAAYAHWIRVNDSAATYSLTSHSSVLSAWMQSGIAQRMGRPVVDVDNGYMLMTMRAPMGSGVHDAFFELRPVDRPAGVTSIDISFTQAYAKFYDECYIDFQVGSDWYAREVNINGVDVDINYYASYYGSWTMPNILAQQSQIKLRFRWYNRVVRSNAYGYFWAIDNVAIVEGNANRWYANDENYVDGGYGQIPQNFNVPLSWYGGLFNNGSTDQLNSTLTMSHIDVNGTASTILSQNVASMPANPLREQYVVVDERGFMPEIDSVGYAGWFGMGTDWTNYGANSLSSGYQGRHVPTTDQGLQYVTATLSNSTTGIAAAEWDTIGYTVVDSIGGDDNLAVSGYRWSHDNGIIPAGVKYAYGWIIVDGNPYITDSGNYGSTNYMVWVRYTTPAEVPAGWVFRGMEIVPQTDVPATQIAGSNIFPIFYEEEYYGGGDSVRFNAVNTGVSDVVAHTVTAAELNTLTTGRLTNDDPYKAVNISYFTQPTIKPNTSYYVGYRIAEPCYFAAARTSYSYKTASGTTSYYRDAATRPYYYQFEPNGYDVRIYDGANTNRPYLWSGFYYSYYPMIRLIVGPERTIPTQHINASCNDNYSIITIDGEDEINICSTGLDAPQGSDPSVYVIPAGDSAILGSHPSVIDNIMIDGQVVDLMNPPAGVQVVERPYNLTNADGDVLLRRYYYIITFSSISSNPTVSATAHAISNGLGIEAEAANVSLGLKPNPASSQVSLNIEGVSGNVNCSIIDMSGRVVVSTTFNAEESHVIDLSNVAAGAYFVRVTNDNFSKIEKLIVR